jgi:hypothetical protein|tara:strand:- start:93 stop:233 length:141 start_codon:yes stop_codon:yes gene_type:complete
MRLEEGVPGSFSGVFVQSPNELNDSLREIAGEFRFELELELFTSMV